MESKPDDSKAPVVVDSDTSASGGEVDVDNQHVVDWDGPNDPENPMNWSTREKAPIICVVTASRFMTYGLIERDLFIVECMVDDFT